MPPSRDGGTTRAMTPPQPNEERTGPLLGATVRRSTAPVDRCYRIVSICLICFDSFVCSGPRSERIETCAAASAHVMIETRETLSRINRSTRIGNEYRPELTYLVPRDGFRRACAPRMLYDRHRDRNHPVHSPTIPRGEPGTHTTPLVGLRVCQRLLL